jgi:tetratricopeptide (TPR) repeat protein
MFHGNALMQAGRPAEAAAVYETARALRPDHPPILYNLGNALLATGDAAGAEARFRAALALAPDHAGSHNNMGNALRQQGRHAEAADSYRAALALRGDLFGAFNNLGAVLLALHQPEAALAALRDSLRLNPDYAEAHNNMGGALLALGDAPRAAAAFARAVALEPTHAQAHLGLALALLTQGRLRAGFAEYEWRWQDPRFAEDLRAYDAPLWLGETDLRGATLLVHHEQGLGDTIQFARYLPLLRARGARVVLEVQDSLLGLLAPLADTALAAGAALPPHAWRTPLLSLPRALGTEPATLPAAVPYLRAAPRGSLRRPGLNVALTLAGSADHGEDALRSIPAALLRPLLALPGITWHLVQKDGGAEAGLPAPVVLGDFADTASALAAMDLCLSVDTAVAHLAGALARPVWIMLQHAADFRWQQQRADSPWYPTARLFRQDADRRWEPVVARVAAALSSIPHPP